MARRSSSALSTELENSDKDTDTRKSAMKALTSHVRDLDSRLIPLLVARVSETKDASGVSSWEYTIPLFEDLARVHGPNIVSQIDIIMGTVIRFLTTSGGSIPRQQACSKIAPNIARYAIEPTIPENEKKHIICMLCKPLCDSILGSQESLSCGAALCLKALVDSDYWRFASDEMVNEVCLKVAGALKDTSTQSNSHMGLVMSLAEHNSLVVEAYAGLLICSGLEILNAGVTERNSQKRLMAIQMINFLMKCLDIRSIYSELDLIIEEMEKCQTDEVIYVRGASYEAIEIARKLIVGKGLEFDPDMGSVTGSNGKSGQGCNLADGNQSQESLSPYYHTFDSFVDNNTLLVDSPFSTTRASCNVDRSANPVSRKLWRAENRGAVNSLKDGILSDIARGGAPRALSERCEASNSLRGYENGFHGCYPETPLKEGFRSQTPSPQRQRPQMSSRSVKIYGTPTRQFVRFQDDNHENTDFYEKQGRRITSPCSVKCGCSSPVAKNSSNSLRNGAVRTLEINGSLGDKGQLSESDSESIFSAEDVPVAKEKLRGENSEGRKKQNKMVKKSVLRTAMKVVLYSILLLLLAVIVSVFWLDVEQEELHLVPT